MSTISWGRRERFAFSCVGALESNAPPAEQAVYAVTYQRDPRNQPKSHTVVFFGQSDNLANDADKIRRNIADAWSRRGGSPEDLFIFVHAMSGSTALERSKVLERLVLEYQPHCNMPED